MVKDESIRSQAVELSETCVKRSPASELCLAAMAHARTLHLVGQLEKANAYATIALTTVSISQPASNRESIKASLEKEAKRIREATTTLK